MGLVGSGNNFSETTFTCFMPWCYVMNGSLTLYFRRSIISSVLSFMSSIIIKTSSIIVHDCCKFTAIQRVIMTLHSPQCVRDVFWHYCPCAAAAVSPGLQSTSVTAVWHLLSCSSNDAGMQSTHGSNGLHLLAAAGSQHILGRRISLPLPNSGCKVMSQPFILLQSFILFICIQTIIQTQWPKT